MNSTSVLLGAGASKEAGAPLAAELTASTLQYFQGVRGLDFDDDTEQALRLLIERLQGSTRAGQRPVDIESLFSALGLLNERNTDLEVTPLGDRGRSRTDAKKSYDSTLGTSHRAHSPS